MNYLKKYYTEIKNGNIIAPKSIKIILVRELRMLQDKKSKYFLYQKKADKVIEFIETYCCHSTGELMGKPIKLALWQKCFISILFGIVNKKTGLRKYKEAFLKVARKNGKSTLASAINLYMMIADGEGGSECYIVASTEQQAMISFNIIWKMVQQSPTLKKVLHKSSNKYEFRPTLSFMRPLTSQNSSANDGLNIHFANIDELHAIKDRNVYEVMTSALSARAQPMILITSTDGFIRGSISDEINMTARNIIGGSTEDDNFLPWIYELDDPKEWDDPKTWQKANPQLFISKSYDDMIREYKKVLADPKKKGNFMAKHLNLKASSGKRLFDLEVINKNKGEMDIKKIYGKYCTLAFDLSNTTDLTAVTFLVPQKDSTIFSHTMYFMPKEKAIEREKQDKMPFSIWEKQGYIIFTEGSTISWEEVKNYITETILQYKLYVLGAGYDPWNANFLARAIQDAGIDIVKVRQGAQTLSEPMKELNNYFLNGKVIYNNNPIDNWCFWNTAVEEDKNENWRPIKPQGESKLRIDGYVSLLIAFKIYQDLKNDFDSLIK